MSIINSIKNIFKNNSASQKIKDAETVKMFNSLVAFKVVPALVVRYNNGEISFEHFSNKSLYCPISSSLVDNISLTKTNIDELEIIILTLPSNSQIAEVDTIIIAHNILNKKAKAYSMEYSFGNKFMICEPLLNEHSNIGTIVSNRKEFQDEVVKLAKSELFEKDENVVKTTESKGQTTTNEFVDILTNPLLQDLNGMDKLDEINSKIVKNADHLLSLLPDYPEVTYDGRVECQIILASTLVPDYDKTVLSRAIALRNNDIDLFKIEQKIDYYRTMFIGFTTCSSLMNEWTLLDFAKIKGKMQIGNLVKPDSYGCLKRAIFTNANGERLMCRFVMLTSDQQNPKYVQEHKHELAVRQYSEDDYVIVPTIFDKYDRSSFYDILAYWIFCNPLAYDDVFNIHKFYAELEKRGIQTNKSNRAFEFAYIESRQRVMDALIELPF